VENGPGGRDYKRLTEKFGSSLRNETLREGSSVGVTIVREGRGKLGQGIAEALKWDNVSSSKSSWTVWSSPDHTGEGSRLPFISHGDLPAQSEFYTYDD